MASKTSPMRIEFVTVFRESFAKVEVVLDEISKALEVVGPATRNHADLLPFRCRRSIFSLNPISKHAT